MYSYRAMTFFFLSALLPDCSLCWDHWNSTVTPTLDAALLSSSRAADLGRLSDVESDAYLDGI